MQLKEQGQAEDVEVKPVVVPYTKDVKWTVLNVLGTKNNPQPVHYYIPDTDMEPNEYAFHLSKLYNLRFQIKLQDNR